jgi:hypothetical protein
MYQVADILQGKVDNTKMILMAVTVYEKYIVMAIRATQPKTTKLLQNTLNV